MLEIPHTPFGSRQDRTLDKNSSSAGIVHQGLIDALFGILHGNNLHIFSVSPEQVCAQHGIAADRFAREIVRILTLFAARSRQLNANPLGGSHHTLSMYHASIQFDQQHRCHLKGEGLHG